MQGVSAVSDPHMPKGETGWEFRRSWLASTGKGWLSVLSKHEALP